MREPTMGDVALFVLARDGGCLGPRLGGTFMECAGRNRIEHVKPEPRMSRKAVDCPCQTLTLCEGHTEPGMRAGYVWCTDKANRAECRAYLHDFGYGPHHATHAVEILRGVAA